MEKVDILILAAGRGVRMGSHGPKALTLLKGKPFLSHIIETLKLLNLVNKSTVVVGHKKERIKEIFGDSLNYAWQEEQLGTGHAVLSAKHKISGKSNTILVLSADQPLVSENTIRKIVKKHQESRAEITIATVNVLNFPEWKSFISQFGRVIRDENKKVKKIVELKDVNSEEKKSVEFNGAIYAFDKNWLWENVNKIKNNNKQEEYYLTDLVELAYAQKKKIETMSLENILEVIQPNSPEELAILENLVLYGLPYNNGARI